MWDLDVDGRMDKVALRDVLIVLVPLWVASCGLRLKIVHLAFFFSTVMIVSLWHAP